MNPNVELPYQIDLGGGKSSWRIADGCIARGREIDGTIERRDQMLGWLRRVGIHHGEYDDGSWSDKLECDIETKNGLETIGVSLGSSRSDGKPSYTAAIMLGLALCEVPEGGLIAIAPKLGKKPNKYGKYTTYPNCYAVNPVTMQSTLIETTIEWDSMQDQFDAMLAAVREHPCFKERETLAKHAEEADLPAEKLLEKECAAKGWPTHVQAPDEWLAMLKKALKRTALKSLSELSEADWAAVRQQATGVEKLPTALEGAVEKAKEYDPFA